MGLIHISDGKRFRECDEADLQFFERKGYKKTGDDKPEEPEKPDEPKKGGKKDDNQNK